MLLPWNIIFIVGTICLLLFLLYQWLIVITEGVFFGRRIVVWLYDMTAHTYDGIKEFESEEEYELVVEPLLAGIRTYQPHILDVATGTGRVPYFLLEDGVFNGTLIGVEPAPKMLAFAEENLDKLGRPWRDQVTLMEHHAVPLPFPDNTFDAITCLESLEFMPSDRAALAEMYRVLKPGGFLMTSRRCEWEAWFFLHRYRSRPGMTQLLESLGYEDVDIDYWLDIYDKVTARKPKN